MEKTEVRAPLLSFTLHYAKDGEYLYFPATGRHCSSVQGAADTLVDVYELLGIEIFAVIYYHKPYSLAELIAIQDDEQRFYKEKKTVYLYLEEGEQASDKLEQSKIKQKEKAI